MSLTNVSPDTVISDPGPAAIAPPFMPLSPVNQSSATVSSVPGGPPFARTSTALVRDPSISKPLRVILPALNWKAPSKPERRTADEAPGPSMMSELSEPASTSMLGSE